MVFVGAPVGDDEWVAEELRFIFGKLVSRLPALARMRDAGRLSLMAHFVFLLYNAGVLGKGLVLAPSHTPRAHHWQK